MRSEDSSIYTLYLLFAFSSVFISFSVLNY